MSDLYRKLHLPSHTYTEILTTIKEACIEGYKVTPKLQKSIVWQAGDHNDGTKELAYSYSVYPNISENLTQPTWDAILTDKFVDMCSKYRLRHDLLVIHADSFFIHRHDLPPNSYWTLTFLLSGSENSRVKFFTPKSSLKLDPNVNSRQLEKDFDLIESFEAGPGDVISLNSKVWHNQTHHPKIHSDDPLQCIVMHLDNKTNSIEERDHIIDHFLLK